MEADEVICQEKLDGANISLYNNGLHARSLNERPHISHSWLKNWHSSIAHLIPEDIRICGEYLYQPHSIRYYDTALKNHWFRAFSVWKNETCLDWKLTEELCISLQIPIVPMLYKGKWNETAIRSCWTGQSKHNGEQEGYVVRSTSKFTLDTFDTHIAKFVRKNHVQDYTPHWMKSYNIAPNGLTLKEVEEWKTYRERR